MGVSRRSVLAGLGLAATVGGAGVLGSTGVSSNDDAPRVNALVAGSLHELASQIPGASVEAHGSVAARRLVLESLRDPDAVALADPRLFSGIVERVTLFATNALVIAYDPTSPFADALRRDWAAALSDPTFELGRTDPRTDPLGYRTVMALRLAARHHEVPADAVLARSSVFLETDLMNVVEGGTVDAAVVYRNMAVQRDLPVVDLPVELDFSSPAHAETYRSVPVDIGGTTVRGTPIQYAATALTDRGTKWTQALVTADERLEAAGFVVPTDYPRRAVSVAESL